MVVVVGETLIELPVAPVDHVNTPPGGFAVADNVAVPPEQIVEFVVVTTGSGFTVTIDACVALHPFTV